MSITMSKPVLELSKEEEEGEEDGEKSEELELEREEGDEDGSTCTLEMPLLLIDTESTSSFDAVELKIELLNRLSASKALLLLSPSTCKPDERKVKTKRTNTNEWIWRLGKDMMRREQTRTTKFVGGGWGRCRL